MMITPNRRLATNLDPDAILDLDKFPSPISPGEIGALYRHLTGGQELPVDINEFLQPLAIFPSDQRPELPTTEIIDRLIVPEGERSARRQLVREAFNDQYRQFLMQIPGVESLPQYQQLVEQASGPLPALPLYNNTLFNKRAAQHLDRHRRLLVRAVGDHLAASIANSGNFSPPRLLAEYLQKFDPDLTPTAATSLARAEQVSLLRRSLGGIDISDSANIDLQKVNDNWSQISAKQQISNRQFFRDFILELLAVRS